MNVELIQNPHSNVIPADKRDVVWPKPQNVPTSDDRLILFDSLTIVETATM